MIDELIKKNRSYRRFDGNVKISREELLKMIDSARCSGSTANRQRIRFALVNDKETCDKLFPRIKLAGYLKEWAGPTDAERPTAYIAMMHKEESTDVNLAIDMGIAAQSILLTATELGYGGCMIRSFDSEAFDKILDKGDYKTAFVIIIGKPSERAYITSLKDGDIKYFRDENDDHAVPKYSLDELII